MAQPPPSAAQAAHNAAAVSLAQLHRPLPVTQRPPWPVATSWKPDGCLSALSLAMQWQNYNYSVAGGYQYPGYDAAGYDAAAAYAHYYGQQQAAAQYAYPPATAAQPPANPPLPAENGEAPPPLPPGTAPPDASTAAGAGAGAAQYGGYAYPQPGQQQQHYYPPASGYGQQQQYGGGGYGQQPQQQQYAAAAPAPHTYVLLCCVAWKEVLPSSWTVHLTAAFAA